MSEAKKSEVEIKKIVVDLGRRELVLTTEEALQLKDALNELFGKVVKEVVKEEHHHHHYPSWRWDWAQPVYVTPITYPVYYQTIGVATAGQSSGITGNAANAGNITYTSNGAGTIQCTVSGGVAEVKK